MCHSWLASDAYLGLCRLSVDKCDNETAEMRKKTVALKQHLSSLRADLARAFANTPAPGELQVLGVAGRCETRI